MPIKKGICKSLFRIGKDLSKHGLPHFKNGEKCTLDNYYQILLGLVLAESGDIEYPCTDSLINTMQSDIGFKCFRMGYYGHMPYEIKSNWQKKRSLRQQRSIQNTNNLSMPILTGRGVKSK